MVGAGRALCLDSKEKTFLIKFIFISPFLCYHLCDIPRGVLACAHITHLNSFFTLSSRPPPLGPLLLAEGLLLSFLSSFMYV